MIGFYLNQCLDFYIRVFICRLLSVLNQGLSLFSINIFAVKQKKEHMYCALLLSLLTREKGVLKKTVRGSLSSLMTPLHCCSDKFEYYVHPSH